LEEDIIWLGLDSGSKDFLQLKIAIIEKVNIAVKRKYFFIVINF